MPVIVSVALTESWWKPQSDRSPRPHGAPCIFIHLLLADRGNQLGRLPLTHQQEMDRGSICFHFPPSADSITMATDDREVGRNFAKCLRSLSQQELVHVGRTLRAVQSTPPSVKHRKPPGSTLVSTMQTHTALSEWSRTQTYSSNPHD